MGPGYLFGSGAGSPLGVGAGPGYLFGSGDVPGAFGDGDGAVLGGAGLGAPRELPGAEEVGLFRGGGLPPVSGWASLRFILVIWR